MQASAILSRRNTERKVDFRPDLDESSPGAQLRRLQAYLETNIAPHNDIDDCDEAIRYWREMTYRKIFTGTTHEQFVATDNHAPDAVDWLIAVAAVDADAYRNNRAQTKERN